MWLGDYPLAALQLTLDSCDNPPTRFSLGFINKGIEPVYLLNPYFLPPDDPDCFSGVLVAMLPQEKQGFTSPPLKWARIKLDYPSDDPRDLIKKVIFAKKSGKFRSTTPSHLS